MVQSDVWDEFEDKKSSGKVPDIQDLCFCLLLDLQSEEIYRSWSGYPYLYLDAKKLQPPIHIKEISKKIKKPYFEILIETA